MVRGLYLHLFCFPSKPAGRGAFALMTLLFFFLKL
jgi:hypothetical protein